MYEAEKQNEIDQLWINNCKKKHISSLDYYNISSSSSSDISIEEEEEEEEIDINWLTRYQEQQNVEDYLKNTKSTELDWLRVFNDNFGDNNNTFGENKTQEHNNRIKESNHFCSNLFNPLYPIKEITCDGEKYIEARQSYIDSISHHVSVEEEMSVEPIKKEYPAFPIRPLDKRKEKCRVRSTVNDVKVKFVIENYVRVTYLYNKDTGMPYTINLCDLGKNMLHYFVEYSRKKFSKINLRILGGGSHLIYASGIIVETGSNNEDNSAYLLEHTINILRRECHLTNIAIEKRECCNIVARGSIEGKSLCLNVLLKQFPWAKKKDRFTGVIITVKDMDDYFKDIAYNENMDDGDEFDFTSSYAMENKEEEDENALISRINGHVKSPIVNIKIENDRLEALDEYQYLITGSGSEKGTFLIFENQIIGAGCKPRSKLRLSCERLQRILAPCIATKENLEWEARLVRGEDSNLF